MSGGGPSDHTTTTTELPAWAQPYAQDLLTRGSALSNQSMPVYSGQRSADMNMYQTAGNNMVYDRASNGSPEINAGSQNLTSTLNGSYLGSGNPYLQSQIDQGAQGLTKNYYDAVKSTDASASKGGVYGGSAWQQMQDNNGKNLATGLGNLESSMRYQNYGDERNRQMQALGMAPTYGNQPYVDAQQLQTVGQNQYAYDQQKIDDGMAQWNEQAQSPYKQLDVLGNTIRGSVGGGGTTTQTAPGANPYAQAAGGAAALYGLLSK